MSGFVEPARLKVKADCFDDIEGEGLLLICSCVDLCARCGELDGAAGDLGDEGRETTLQRGENLLNICRGDAGLVLIEERIVQFAFARFGACGAIKAGDAVALGFLAGET